MATILHLLPTADWESTKPFAPVTNTSLATDGFIHCTDDRDVLLQVANNFYRGLTGEFVVLEIDTDRLTAECVWEEPAHVVPTDTPPAAPSFPHIYGPINRGAIIGVVPVMRDAAGAFAGYDARRA